ncbi:hypothetical protein ACEQPO_27215 [Bacillus sp. SL00103]
MDDQQKTDHARRNMSHRRSCGTTPAAGFVTPFASIIIGIIGGIVCFWESSPQSQIGYDDALDAFGLHGIGGTWGGIATGLFATTSVCQ